MLRTTIEVGLLLAAMFVLIAVASTARAGSTCYMLGNQYVCNGDNGFNSNSYQLGNQTITNGTYRDPNSGQTRTFNQTCYMLGNQRICN
jgi:hypothetical protein